MPKFQDKENVTLLNDRTAILVDGAFYRRRAFNLFGDKSPEDRAEELIRYCTRHLTSAGFKNRLYRIYYYDCPPIEGNLYHPLKQKPVCMKDTDTYKWSKEFYKALATKRKVALRMGKLQEQETGYRIKDKVVSKLCRGELDLSDLTEDDFKIDVVQKGVDMKIGIDITMLASKQLVQQIVLVSGDSDFVPAAKYARREGVDFILDPMWQPVKEDLMVHVDGLKTCTSRTPDSDKETLHYAYKGDSE